MAYAWCLRQGYHGIVTIDGNGKDGVEAVADITAKLDEGSDYVQGSRYLPGGEAENTPLERTIANRLIHAPLLSISGRHFFTDTTNGFRGYSARYLTHPDVRPFRDEFQVYSLLFYLTVRAGQLGLKVDHVPVVRRYPQSGKVPTKIGGLSSKLALLGETVFAATGGYTPASSAARLSAMFWPLLLTVLVAVPLFASMVIAPRYSPDSWALYELSQTLWDDFYRFSHLRSYASDAPYSSAFPPLYPTLIALIDGVFATGPRTGLYLAFACFIGFALVSEQIGRRVTGAAWVGLGAALLVVLGPGMLPDELAAGRTTPLQLLLYAIILRGLLRREALGLAGAAGIGVLAGLAILNRFDAALLPLLCAGMIGWTTRKPALALASLAGAAIAVSPWIAFSLNTFGVIFATDNAGIATSLDPKAFVTDWWPAAQPSLGDDLAAWLAKLTSNLGNLVYTAIALLFSPMGLALAAALALPAALQYVASRRPQAGAPDLPAKQGLGLLATFAAMMAVMMAPQVISGYIEYRYFNALFWAAFLAALCALILTGANIHQRRNLGRIVGLVIAAVALPFATLQMLQAAKDGTLDSTRWSDFAATEDVKNLKSCISDNTGARVLVLGDNRFVAKAGALGGLATMMEPRNMMDGRLDRAGSRAFIESWRVDYVLIADASRADFARTTFDLDAVAGCPLALYRVRRAN
jgi:multidrug transporter EmrE-like cation transporter